MKIVFQYD